MKNHASTLTRLEVAVPAVAILLLALPSGIAAHVALETLLLTGGILAWFSRHRLKRYERLAEEGIATAQLADFPKA